ncbi:hypothetical protein ACFY05_29550 [Microtetraspora fusca]|uniref:Uncharacterized protein n=1 Tax=Microtetraspora fusca TaxID=1997 RepID=A0ABW6VDA7_MICFU
MLPGEARSSRAWGRSGLSGSYAADVLLDAAGAAAEPVDSVFAAGADSVFDESLEAEVVDAVDFDELEDRLSVR